MIPVLAGLLCAVVLRLVLNLAASPNHDLLLHFASLRQSLRLPYSSSCSSTYYPNFLRILFYSILTFRVFISPSFSPMLVVHSPLLCFSIYHHPTSLPSLLILSFLSFSKFLAIFTSLLIEFSIFYRHSSS